MGTADSMAALPSVTICSEMSDFWRLASSFISPCLSLALVSLVISATMEGGSSGTPDTLAALIIHVAGSIVLWAAIFIAFRARPVAELAGIYVASRLLVSPCSVLIWAT